MEEDLATFVSLSLCVCLWGTYSCGYKSETGLRCSLCVCVSFSVVTEGSTKINNWLVRSPSSMCGWFGVRVGECVLVVMEVSAIATRSCIWFGLSSC